VCASLRGGRAVVTPLHVSSYTHVVFPWTTASFVGLFASIVGLFSSFVGLFSSVVGLFALCMGLFPSTVVPALRGALASDVAAASEQMDDDAGARRSKIDEKYMTLTLMMMC